ncbi:DUF4381 domain-containing protein [Reyranella sp.]|uniref:DUF4381 domain-containing protein n=1 Tax=Reyranella sp. TaxID=1929291 RepID=UPI0011FD4815|nr:DUF4381 domain-containing protein [Reyranella sp.]TAJ87400.1 MAG: DUF4381 domain-containing protein [Reyranella sp.]
MSDPADLSNLRDIVMPPEVALWPPAPGWWILLAGAVAMAVIFAGMIIARYRRNAYRRAALAALDNAEPGDISTILKRAALAAWPRTEVASLTGTDWLAFLDRTARTNVFTQGAGRDLEAMAFGGAGDKQAVLTAARSWVRRHRC